MTEREVPLLTKPEAARELHISPRTLDRLMANGKIRCVRVSDRAVRIPRTEIQRICEGK